MPIRVQMPGGGVAEFPDEMPESEIESVLASHAPEGETRTWTDTAVDSLPLVGGSIGGLLGTAGGPLGMAGGAALGGAGGEAWKQNINRLRGKKAPGTMGEAAADIGVAGAVQGASEAAGGVVGKGLQRGGHALYRGLLKPSKAIGNEFGGKDVVRTLMDEGATISQKGAAKIGTRLGESSARADSMVADAAPGSSFVKPQEIIREFQPVIAELRKRAAVGQPNELGRVGDRGRRLVKSLSSNPVDAGGSHELKRTAQHSANGALRMIDRGGKAQLSADDLLDEATARGFRKATETRVPGVAAQNQRTQRLIGGSRAMDDALQRTSNNLAVGPRDVLAALAGSSVGGPLGGAAGAGASMLTRLMMSPRGGSATAIGMDRTGKALQKLPIDELIRALTLASQEGQQ